MFLHDYLLACEISTVRTQTLNKLDLSVSVVTQPNHGLRYIDTHLIASIYFYNNTCESILNMSTLICLELLCIVLLLSTMRYFSSGQRQYTFEMSFM